MAITKAALMKRANELGCKTVIEVQGRTPTVSIDAPIRNAKTSVTNETNYRN